LSGLSIISLIAFVTLNNVQNHVLRLTVYCSVAHRWAVSTQKSSYGTTKFSRGLTIQHSDSHLLVSQSYITKSTVNFFTCQSLCMFFTNGPWLVRVQRASTGDRMFLLVSISVA